MSLWIIVNICVKIWRYHQLIKCIQLYTILQLQIDSRASMGPNIMCGPCEASTPLHGDGRLCDISAVHLNVVGQNEVMIFPRQASLAKGMEIYNLMYNLSANEQDGGSDVFKSPRQRVRCIFAHSHSLYCPFLYQLLMLLNSIYYSLHIFIGQIWVMNKRIN